MDKEIRMNAEAIMPAVSDGITPVIYADRINALIETMKAFGVPNRAYTLFGLRDDSMCLLYQDGEWVTFTYEKGCEESRTIHSDFDDAAIAVIESGAESLDELTKMVKHYSSLASKEPQFPRNKLNDAIQNIVSKLMSAAAL